MKLRKEKEKEKISNLLMDDQRLKMHSAIQADPVINSILKNILITLINNIILLLKFSV